MVYNTSPPLQRWLTNRREALLALEDDHAQVGAVGGRGHPLSISKPLAHAYTIVVMSQFQGFARDLHDLAVEHLVDTSGAEAALAPILTRAMTSGCAVDSGNATHANIKRDFARLGVSPWDISAVNTRWTNGDQDQFNLLLRLRNCLAHSNDADLQRLLTTTSVQDSVTWTRSKLPVLNRYARSMDKLVWEHLKTTTGRPPW